MNLPLPRLNDLLMTVMLGLLVLLAPGAAQAQFGGAFGPKGDPHIKASLLAESATPAPGSTVTLAILMKPDKGWHGYWANPGDAGAGMTVDWVAPSGVTLAPFRYPVPERLVIAGLMNHVYEHDYAVLLDVVIPVTATRGMAIPIRGKAQWLACTDTICVPEAGEIATTLTVGDGVISPDSRARFDAFRKKLPRPLDQQANYAIDGNRISIAMPYPAAAPVGEPWFFALSKQRIRYAEAQTVRRTGDMLIVETAVPEGATATGAIEGVLAVTPDVALQIKAMPGHVPAGGEVVSGAEDRAASSGVSLAGVLFALGGAFLGGLILNIMPCVFPILSLKAISLAKAGGEEGKVRGEAIAYTLGILVTCLALGALMLAIRAGGDQIGWAFQLQDPRVIAVLLLLMVAITLNLAGAFEIGTVSLGQGKAGQGGASGAFWTGALAAFVATPCTGPFMGAAMGAALVLPWPIALIVFAGLGLGLASPFIAIAYVPALRRLMPRPGTWMRTFKLVMAVPMGLTALALLWLLSQQLGTGGIALGIALAVAVAILLALLGRRQRAGLGINWLAAGVGGILLGTAAIAAPPLVRSDKSDAASHLVGEPFSETKLAALRQSNKPVFLYFTADWCLTCKVNEANAIDTDAVKTAFDKGGVAVMVGDWTSADPAISRFLEANGRAGVPLYLYYAPGASKPQILPQVLTPGTLTALVRA